MKAMAAMPLYLELVEVRKYRNTLREQFRTKHFGLGSKS
jgi:hypothetical protein